MTNSPKETIQDINAITNKSIRAYENSNLPDSMKIATVKALNKIRKYEILKANGHKFEGALK